MTRVREWAFRAAAIAVALLLFEGGLGAFGLPGADGCWMPKESYWLPDPELGFAYRPGASVAGGTINAIGLRGPVPAPEKPPGVMRVLYLGDSSAFGFGVTDEESYWSLATHDLAARAGAPAEPIVAAAPGYSSWHSRVLLGRFADAAPDWIVLYVGAYNDHRRRAYFTDAEIPARMARRETAWHRVRTLQTGELVADRLGKWLGRQLRDPADLARVPVPDFEENLRAMLDVTAATGARTIVLVPPYSEKLRARRGAIPRYETALREAAQRSGATIVELGPAFAALGDAAFQRDQIHPSVAGHRAIADVLATALLSKP
jgi:lysophospholipase L1-like esterase